MAVSVSMLASGSRGNCAVVASASTKILVQSILAIAFSEAIVFYALFLVK